MSEKKTKYHTHVQPRLKEIEAWCREGLIDSEIAKRLGIGYDTFNKYKKLYKALSDALIAGKAIADYRVEDALFKRATGYTTEEVVKERKLNKETGQTELVVAKIVTKEVAPDPTSMIFWLKNRQPLKWRDKQDIKLEGSLDIEAKYSHMTEEELDKEIEKMEKVLKDGK